ncbi:hypothetical protein [Kiloniella sp.]|uniref:hypothetical protein n=1 Tax=Kiloniella sp. TaxID=1938587 RepID=UPI003B01F0F9
MKKFLIAITLISLNGCSLPKVTSFTIEPTVRQQVYSDKKGSPDAIPFGCQTDHTGLGAPYFEDLAFDEAHIGYQSLELPRGVRPRCRFDYAMEHQAVYYFNLEDYIYTNLATTHPDTGELTGGLITTDYVFDPENEFCSSTPTTQISGVMTNGFYLSEEPSPGTPHRAIKGPPVDLDGELIPFPEINRQRASLDPAIITAGSGHINIALTERQIEHVQDMLDRSTLNLRLNVLFLGPENPNWRQNHHCLSRINNTRLVLFFGSETE